MFSKKNAEVFLAFLLDCLTLEDWTNSPETANLCYVNSQMSKGLRWDHGTMYLTVGYSLLS
jgi:hypothetical protein